MKIEERHFTHCSQLRFLPSSCHYRVTLGTNLHKSESEGVNHIQTMETRNKHVENLALIFDYQSFTKLETQDCQTHTKYSLNFLFCSFIYFT